MPTFTFRTFPVIPGLITGALVFLTFFALVLLIFTGYLEIPHISILVMFSGPFFTIPVTERLIRSAVTMSVGGETVSFIVRNSFLNTEKRYAIPRSEVSSFEIYRTGMYDWLYFYRDDQRPEAFYVIQNAKDRQALAEFLNGHFAGRRAADARRPSFRAAFSTALRNLALPYLGSAAGIILLNVWYYLGSGTLPESGWKYLPALILLPFLFYFNRLHYRTNFRIQARNVTWISLAVAGVGLCASLPGVLYPLLQRPVTVEDLHEAIVHENSRFFIAPAPRADTTDIGYSQKISSGSRSRYQTARHFFTVPVRQKDRKLRHGVWIGLRYDQKRRKNLKQAERAAEQLKFTNSAAAAFKKAVHEKAGFYQVLDDRYFYYSASSTRQIRGPMILLGPHVESFTDYRSSKLGLLMTGCAAGLLLLLANASAIAYYR